MIGAGEGNIRQSRSMSANQLPSLWSFFCIWDGSFSPLAPADFRPDGLFSVFGTEVSRLAIDYAYVEGSIPSFTFHKKRAGKASSFFMEQVNKIVFIDASDYNGPRTLV